MTILTTIMSVAIHKPGQNPDHGEGVNHLTLEDEGAGFFFVLTQPVPYSQREGIAIDPDELEAIAAAGRMLMAQEGVREK